MQGLHQPVLAVCYNILVHAVSCSMYDLGEGRVHICMLLLGDPHTDFEGQQLVSGVLTSLAYL